MKKIMAFFGLAIIFGSSTANAVCSLDVDWGVPVVQSLIFSGSCKDAKDDDYHNRTKAYSYALFTWVHLNTDTQDEIAGVSWHTNQVWGIPGIHSCEIRGYYEKRGGGYKSLDKVRRPCL